MTHAESTINWNHCTGDVRSVGGCEEHNCSRYFFGTCEASQRNGVGQRRNPILRQRSQHVCCNRTRSDDVGGDCCDHAVDDADGDGIDVVVDADNDANNNDDGVINGVVGDVGDVGDVGVIGFVGDVGAVTEIALIKRASLS